MKVQASTWGGKEIEGEFDVSRAASGGRIWHAAKYLVFFWLAALFAVVIPVLHFVLVPAFLICGPVAMYLALKKDLFLRGAQLNCPGCASQLEIPDQYVKWPLRITCRHCFERISVREI